MNWFAVQQHGINIAVKQVQMNLANDVGGTYVYQNTALSSSRKSKSGYAVQGEWLTRVLRVVHRRVLHVLFRRAILLLLIGARLAALFFGMELWKSCCWEGFAPLGEGNQ